MVLMAGLEPARPTGQQILSLLCLPFHHISIEKKVGTEGFEPSTQRL